MWKKLFDMNYEFQTVLYTKIVWNESESEAFVLAQHIIPSSFVFSHSIHFPSLFFFCLNDEIPRPTLYTIATLIIRQTVCPGDQTTG